MVFKTITLSLLIEEDAPPSAATDYAIRFCEREQAHLNCFIGAPIISIPSGMIVAQVRDLVEQENATRLQRARQVQAKIETSARLGGVVCECHVVQDVYPTAVERAVAAARVSDLAILSRSKLELALAKDLVEAMLFESGRPVIVVPIDWGGGGATQKIVVAWDGGHRAARAVGDAMPLLASAGSVDVVCVSPDAAKTVSGADLAVHLARHCRVVTLSELPPQNGDAAAAIRTHLAALHADLLVMGAFAHSRLRQFLRGGVTNSLLNEANLPVLFSY